MAGACRISDELAAVREVRGPDDRLAPLGEYDLLLEPAHLEESAENVLVPLVVLRPARPVREEAQVIEVDDGEVVAPGVVVKGAVPLGDGLKSDPNAAHEARGHAVEVDRIGVCALLRTHGEVERLHRNGEPPVEQAEQAQNLRQAGETLDRRVERPRILNATCRPERSVRTATTWMAARIPRRSAMMPEINAPIA